MNNHQIISLAALLGMLAVLLGAFGAHGLEKWLPEQMLQRYHTGVEYQFYHALALLLTGLLPATGAEKFRRYAAYAFIAGILLFSGSLYTYALSGIRSFGMITPLGGLCFISGWWFLFRQAQQMGNNLADE